MNFNKKIMCLLIVLICFMFLSVSSAYYKGTGFTHNVPDNYYSSYSTDDILSKYNDTYLTSEKRAVCTNVVDGDTIYLSNGEKVRLVGVNTPERGVKGYKTSKNFVKKLCLNKEVGINVDDKKFHDKYGRTLAVVIVDGKNLNEMLLKEHLAEVMYIPPSEFYPYKWADSISTYDSTSYTTASTDNNLKSDTSQQSSASVSSSSSAYVGNQNSHKYHRFDCEAVTKMSEKNKVYFKTSQDALNQGYKACKICNP